MSHTDWSSLDRRIFVGDAGARGLGLFLSDGVPAGTVLVQLRGEVMDEAEFRAHIALVRPFYALAVGEFSHLVLDPEDPARLGNHSCEPTMWHQDAVTLVARRDLGPGTELTTDYALHTVDPDFTMECACGEERCRRVIAGTDWRLQGLQQRYPGRFSPFINDRIAQGWR